MLHNIISPHEAIIPQDNIIVHLVFAVIDNYSLPIKLIPVNKHLLHRWSGNLSTSNLCTPDTRGRAPTVGEWTGHRSGVDSLRREVPVTQFSYWKVKKKSVDDRTSHILRRK